MSTTFTYINLASALVATMVLGGTNPLMALFCIVWLALATWQAYRDGVIEN